MDLLPHYISAAQNIGMNTMNLNDVIDNIKNKNKYIMFKLEIEKLTPTVVYATIKYWMKSNKSNYATYKEEKYIVEDYSKDTEKAYKVKGKEVD